MFKQDEILFRAVSPGGTSLASDQDFIPADTADSVIAQGGLGALSRLDLDKVLAGTTAFVRADIGQTEEALGGGAASKDLETMFQLVYLTFTAPRADPVAFQVLRDQLKVALANRQAQPDAMFDEALDAALTRNHPRALPLTPARVDQMNLDKSLAFYKDRFADASDFTFVFAGSFDLETMKPLVERYLGALPSTGRRETWKDVGVTPPAGVVEKSIAKGIEPKSRASVVFSGPFVYDSEQRIVIRALGQLLQTRLRDILREELGGTYTVSAAPSYTKYPQSRYTLSIDFGCSPDRTEALLKSVFADVEKLKAEGPTEKQVSDVREQLIREFETNSKQNFYLVTQLSFRYQYNEDVAGLFSMVENLKKLSAESIRNAATKYLDTKNYVKGTLFPEPKTAGELPGVAVAVAR
jgi:zinc protease